jgi:hypothetical protein
MGADVRLLFSPARTYRELLIAPSPSPWRHVARRFVLIAAVIGTSVALSTTTSVAARVVASTTAWWSVAPLIQIGAATLLVLSTRSRPVTLARGVELMVAGHAPWSLWLLAMGACFAAGAGGSTFRLAGGISLLAVLLWRYLLLYHFCRVILACNRAAAILRTTLHQAAILALLFVYVSWAIALTARTSG